MPDQYELEILKHIITRRRSIRKFSDRKVSVQKVKELLSIASFAPSSCNLQAWHFVFVDDDEIKKEIVKRGVVNKQALKSPCIIVAAYNRNVTKEHYANYQSLAAAIQNFLLVAHANGLGTLWLCNFKSERGIREVLNIPDKYRVLAIIEVGYPAESPRTPKRRLVDEILSINKYRSINDIPDNTILKKWTWENVLNWQRQYVWRGYPLEKCYEDERRYLSEYILFNINEAPAIELFTFSGYISSEINKKIPVVDLHFADESINEVARKFESSIDKRDVIIGNNIKCIDSEKYKNYIIINKFEHMPDEEILNILKSIAIKKPKIFIIVFRNSYSWYGIYDFIMRKILRKIGIDDIYPWSLRHLGPWRLLSKGKMKNLLKESGFSIINTEGFFCFPFYRLIESERIINNNFMRVIVKLIYKVTNIGEYVTKFIRLNRIIGEQIIIVCKLKNMNRGVF